MLNDQEYQMYKIVIIGDSGTGKTNIATRFAKTQFDQHCKSTVGVEFFTKIITINNTKIKITIWDTAGQERYKSLSKVYYKGAAGIIIVYDITQPQTYANVQSWLKLANQNLNLSHVKILLLGNKIDRENDRKIYLSKAVSDYESSHEIGCYEVSAKTGQGITEAFMNISTSKYSLKSEIYQINHNIKESKTPQNSLQIVDDQKMEQKISVEKNGNVNSDQVIQIKQQSGNTNRNPKKKCCRS